MDIRRLEPGPVRATYCGWHYCSVDGGGRLEACGERVVSEGWLERGLGTFDPGRFAMSGLDRSTKHAKHVFRGY